MSVIRGVITPAVVIALALAPLSYAGLQSDYHATCDNVSETAGTGLEQKKTYCDSAKQALSASDIDAVMWKVWAAVAAGCLANCAYPPSDPTGWGCTVLSGLATVTDAIYNKSLANAFTQIAASLAPKMIAEMTSTSKVAENATEKTGEKAGEKAGNEAASKNRLAACMGALSASAMTYSKYASVTNSEKSAQNNIDQAKALIGTGLTTSTSNQTVGGGFNTEANSNNNVGRAALSTAHSNSNNEALDANTTCGSAKQTQNYSAIVSCATAASGSDMGKALSNPNFVQDFKKTSGMNIGDFMSSNFSNPSEALGKALGGNLDGENKNKLANALMALENSNIPASPTQLVEGGDSYSTGGAHGASANSDTGNDLSAMMQNMMGQLLPGQKDNQGAMTGVNAVVFANRTQSSFQIAENPKLGIFDRVTYRYFFVGSRILGGGTTQTQQNR